MQGMNSLNCISYNVKGLGNPVKRKKILNQLKKLHGSIAVIQEAHLSEIEHQRFKREGWIRFTVPLLKRGTAIIFNKSVYFNHTQTVNDKEGRYVMVRGTIEGIKITLLNLYAPNKDCIDLF